MTITHHIALLAIALASACHFTAQGQSPAEVDAAPGETPGDDTTMPDAMPPGDATDDDDDDDVPVTCPASYTITVPSSSSRYRIVTDRAPFVDHHAACREELAATHLIAIDHAAELAEIFAHVGPSVGPVYVGAVQMPGELGVADGWQIFTGQVLPDQLWWFDQPNDADHWESFDEQRAAVDVTGKLHDVSGAVPFGAICECDLQPIAPAVLSALTFD
jgi:hypothetical protein